MSEYGFATGGYVSGEGGRIPRLEHTIDKRWEKIFSPDVEYVPRPDESGIVIDKFVNDKFSETIRVEEELVTGAVIAILRKKGYTVIEPKEGS